MSETLLIGLAAIVVLGAAAQWIAWRLRLPSILLLLLTGILAGPEVAGLLDADLLFGDALFPIVSLSVGILLFEGGLTLRLPELGDQRLVVFKLVTMGAAVTCLLTTLAAHLLLGFTWSYALLLGAILVVTGPTVILPLLRQIRPTGAVGPVLKWEGILIDPVGAVLAVLVLEGILAGSGGEAFSRAIWGILRTIGVGGLIGVVAGWGLSRLLERFLIPDHLHNAVALAAAIGAFTLSNHFQHESGLLAVTLMGVYLANQKRTPIHHIVEFKENIRVLILSSLFIILASRLRVDQFAGLGWGAAAFLAVLVVVVRPAAVLACTRGSTLTRKERAFLSSMAPRGIVAAAVSTLFALRLEAHSYVGADLIPSMTFAVIIVTVLVYGLGARPLAIRLGLAVRQPQGMLLLGAQQGSRALAQAVNELGIRTLLVDTNAQNAAKARMAGLDVHHGSLLGEDANERLDLSGLGRLLALTPNDEVNSLATIHYAHLFGRREIYQLAAADGQEKPGQEISAHLRGRKLAGYRELDDRVARGETFRATKLTEQFSLEDWRREHGEDALPLLTIDSDGVVTLPTANTPLEPGPGQTLVALVPGDSNQRHPPT